MNAGEAAKEQSFDDAPGKIRKNPLRQIVRRSRAFHMRSKGFTGRSARKWIREIDADFLQGNGYTVAEKLRAYSWGFLPSTIDYLGVSKQNRSRMISERAYLYLHPMNGKYDKWVRDRVSALNVFAKFQDSFEPCHFHIVRRMGEPFLIPLSEEAKAVSYDMKGLYDFISTHGEMVLTTAAWSSLAVWSVDVIDEGGAEGFLVNGVPFTFDELYLWLEKATARRVLVLIERKEATSWFDSLAPESEASLKVIMINRDGSSPFAGQALVHARYLLQEDGSEMLVGGSVSDDELSEEIEPDASGRRRSVLSVEEAKLDEEDIDSGGDGYDDGDDLPLNVQVRSRPTLDLYSDIDVATGSFGGLRSPIERGVSTLTEAPESGVPFKGTVPEWHVILENLSAMCRFVPQVEFVEFELRIESRGFVITAIRTLPAFYDIVPFSPVVNEFLLSKYHMKMASNSKLTVRFRKMCHNLSLKIRRTFAAIVAPKGLVPYQSTRWIGDVFRDLRSQNGLSLKTKLWAYKQGFLSYRVPQYGITRENHAQFISDFEYRWLRHINIKYKYWLEDKITLKYVAAGFKDCFPAYYYYTSLKDGKNRVIPMMDIPEGYGADYEDILRLAKDRSVLALKPDEGSHGEGFFCLSWEYDHFELNGNPASEADILGILRNPANQYLITEYIQMHTELMAIYPGSVNTIRVTVFKKDGRTPEIGNVYMRIGSSKTGAVDNVAAGGIVASVDIETGRYGDARMLDGVNQGNVMPCPRHPDTNVAIEGVLPNWDYAKACVLEMASAIPQLEYLGFDLAITEQGIKIPEINRFPDFPRVDKLEPHMIEYLLFRLAYKKKLYGYDVFPCRKILALPERRERA